MIVEHGLAPFRSDDPVEPAQREIGATDLSRRIGAIGPQDELRTLADTIDLMLDRLDGAFRAERTLVEDVSHELRNPVAVIQANVEAVLSRNDVSSNERAEATTVVSRATGRMSRPLDDLLATARKRSDAFVDSDVDLAGVVASVAEEHRVLAAERSLRLDLRLVSGPVVYADPASLDHALSNLLANAVRLAPTGSVITVAVGSRQGWAWAEVRDQGPGIAADDRDRVFERFPRARGDRTAGAPERPIAPPELDPLGG